MGKRILLVEDNEFNCEIAGTLLEKAGFIVEFAENGKIAVQKALQAVENYYDVVLMDIQMPIMNGYEAVKAIRQLVGERERTKIIAVTANAFDSDRKNAVEACMDSYISKLIDVDKLYVELRNIL